MMRSGNPVLKDDTFIGVPQSTAGAIGPSSTMTLQGTVNKTLILGALLLVPAMFTWQQYFTGNFSTVNILMWGGGIGGFIFAIATAFKPTWAPITAPIYALLKGAFLGGISAYFESRFPGIVIQAVGATLGVLFALLMAYKSGLIKATENFKLGVAAATGGIFLVYLVGFVMSFFGSGIPYIHESGMIGIGFSVFVVVIASLNLVMDFDFIEDGAERGAPKHMEWYGAFGLMVTLVWLYIEMLRLLAKLQSRD